MTTTSTHTIASGTWTLTLPTGVTAAFSIDAAAGRWSVDVWRGSRFVGPVMTSVGSLDDADWFAWAIAFGAAPFPPVD